MNWFPLRVLQMALVSVESLEQTTTTSVCSRTRVCVCAGRRVHEHTTFRGFCVALMRCVGCPRGIVHEREGVRMLSCLACKCVISLEKE